MGFLSVAILFALVANVFSNEVATGYPTLQNLGGEVCVESTAGPQAQIYCYGRILKAVMAHELYNDSKTFVDKPLLYPPANVSFKFDQRFPTDDNITLEDLKAFIDENFRPEHQELETCDLTDWTEKPPKLAEIVDPTLQKFALDLNKIWTKLCRQIQGNYTAERDLHSLINVPNKFVVPGGRFQGMNETVRDILFNFASLMNQIGFIPNGGRIYYLARSQPPMLIPMFYEYLEATGDYEFVFENLPMLEKEFAFWDNRRNVSVEVGGKPYNMYQYRAGSYAPRPESYREDVELVSHIANQTEKERIWHNLASAAESGIDFSSRWLRGNLTDLSTIDTTNIIPVDLNAFMCRNMEIMAHFYSLKPDGIENELSYRQRHSQFKRDFQKVFYLENEKGWYDFDLVTKTNNVRFYPQNVIPIFARCYDSLDRLKAEQIYKRMQEFKMAKCPGGVFSCPNGIPSSTIESGQQWDSPNIWPPLEHMVIDGLRRSESAKLQEYAFDIAQKWIRTNYLVYVENNAMFEKYNAVELKKGTGGEYETPAGFGWTNGVILDLLTTYGARLNFSEIREINPTPSTAKPRTDTVIEVGHYYHYESFGANNVPPSVFTILLFFLVSNY